MLQSKRWQYLIIVVEYNKVRCITSNKQYTGLCRSDSDRYASRATQTELSKTKGSPWFSWLGAE
jgi:hypothetical protein